MCRSCHADIYETFKETGMGRSLYAPHEGNVIEDYAKRNVVHDPRRNLSYRMFTENGKFYQEEFRLDAGGQKVHSLVREVKYIVGSGNHVRSYITELNGFVFELPVSWYAERKKWDLSPGFQKRNLRFGRVILQECLGCHNSYVPFVRGSLNKYEFPFEEGISCERCHGPGALHVNYRLKQKRKDREAAAGRMDSTIVNPARLERAENVDVCQQCHLPGIMQVTKPGRDDFDFRPGMRLSEVKTIFVAEGQQPHDFGIASHPERLSWSACFQKSGTLTCTTCHNPHVTVSRTPRSQFNRPCMNCHPLGEIRSLVRGRPHRASDDCVSCHMRQGGTSDIPHVVFTDHWIRKPVPSDSRKSVSMIMSGDDGSGTGVVALTDFFKEQDAQAGLRLGIAYYKYFWNKHRDETYLGRAEYVLSKAVLDHPAEAQAHFYLGLVFRVQDRYSEAIREFHKTLNIDSSYVKAHFWIGDALYNQKAYTDAIRHFEHEASIMPHDPQVFLKLGNCYAELGMDEEAIVAYRRATEVNPAFLDGYLNFGLVSYSRLQRYDEAVEAYRCAIRLDPDNVDAYFNLGTTYFLAGRYEEAIPEYRRAIEREADHEGAHMNLAVAYTRLKKNDLARDVLQSVLRFNPRNVQARTLLNELQPSM